MTNWKGRSRTIHNERPEHVVRPKPTFHPKSFKAMVESPDIAQAVDWAMGTEGAVLRVEGHNVTIRTGGIRHSDGPATVVRMMLALRKVARRYRSDA